MSKEKKIKILKKQTLSPDLNIFEIQPSKPRAGENRKIHKFPSTQTIFPMA